MQKLRQQSDSVSLVWARLIRVLRMVPCDKFGGMVEFSGKEPQSFFIGTCITGPADKVEELAVTPSPINLRVKDFLNFIFDFSINLNWRQQRLNSVQNSAWMGEFELGDMEDGVHRSHRVGESEGEGMGTRLHYDREGSGILVGELLGGVHRPKVLSFHIDFISYLDVWQSRSPSVHGALVVLLH